MEERKEFRKTCDCGREFHAKSSYYSHKGKCDGEPSAKSVNNFVCKENDCIFKTNTAKILCKHLKSVHNIEIEFKEKVFQSFSDFEVWKTNFEEETKAFFSYFTSRETPTGKVVYYRCNRSGVHNCTSSGKRAPKSHGVRKIGHICLASIKVCIEPGKINAKICDHHYGHEKELSHLPIPKHDKQMFANQLSQGMNPSRILENSVVGENHELKRMHIVTEQDLRNISRKMRNEACRNSKDEYQEIREFLSDKLFEFVECQIEETEIEDTDAELFKFDVGDVTLFPGSPILLDEPTNSTISNDHPQRKKIKKVDKNLEKERIKEAAVSVDWILQQAKLFMS